LNPGEGAHEGAECSDNSTLPFFLCGVNRAFKRENKIMTNSEVSAEFQKERQRFGELLYLVSTAAEAAHFGGKIKRSDVRGFAERLLVCSSETEVQDHIRSQIAAAKEFQQMATKFCNVTCDTAVERYIETPKQKGQPFYILAWAMLDLPELNCQ
jgi:hypothetical protein